MKNVFRFVLIVVAIQFANFNLVNAQTNLISNPGFEAGLASWWPYGINQATIDSTGGHTGAKLLVLNTMVSADGAAVGQYGVPCKEGNYTFSFWIKGDSTFIGVVLNGLDTDGIEFPARWVGGSDWATKGNPNTWEKVSYNFDVVANAGETGLNLRLFIKSNKKNVGSKVLIDDASLVRNNAAPPVDANNLILNPGFESGLVPWTPYAVDQATIDSTGGYTGGKSLVINTMVSADGAAVAQYGVPCKVGNYTFSVWIKGDSTNVGVILNGFGADGIEFPARWVGGSDWATKGNPNTWEKVSYNFDVVANAGETGLNLRLFIKSNKKNVGSKVLVDDASLVRNNPAPPVDANNVILNPGFESGLAPWLAYSGLNDGSHASIDSTGGYTGAKLLVITTPAKFASGEGGAGVAQNDVPAQLGGNYTYSAWLKGDSTYIGVIEKGLDSDGIEFIRWIGGSDAAAKAKPDTWEKVAYTFDLTNDGETNVTLRLFVYSKKKRIGSQVLVDDASLVKNPISGISKINEQPLRIYPNPVVDKLNISLQTGISEVSIYDISGKPICKNTFGSTSVSLNVSNLAKGVYMVKVNNKYFRKIVK